MSTLLTCRALEVGYAGRAILPPIDVEVGAGELLLVIGRNGSGKSTWFRTALGLLPPVRGDVAHAPDAAPTYMPQRMAFDPLYPVTVRQVVGMGTMRGWSFLRPGRHASHPKVAEALDATGAAPLADRTFRSLSEGQKQRVLLARMVASGARIAYLDEPTAAMDAVAEREAMEALAALRDRFGLAFVVVSHHLAVAAPFATRALMFDPDAGAIVSGTPAEVFAHDVFRARYGGEVAGA